MDKEKKKRLVEEYKNRKPEMGIISFCCVPTGEAFLAASKDTRADFNSNRCKLDSSWHPNNRLLELWNQYGENNFELSVVQTLKYEDPAADYSGELEKMLKSSLQSNSSARRIWR